MRVTKDPLADWFFVVGDYSNHGERVLSRWEMLEPSQRKIFKKVIKQAAQN